MEPPVNQSQPVGQQSEVAKKSSLPVMLTILGLAVILFGGAGIFYMSYKSAPAKYTQPTTKTTAMNGNNQQGIQPTQAMTQSAIPSSGDPQIDQSTQKIDTALNALDTDVNNATQSINDQPGDLSTQ